MRRTSLQFVDQGREQENEVKHLDVCPSNLRRDLMNCRKYENNRRRLATEEQDVVKSAIDEQKEVEKGSVFEHSTKQGKVAKVAHRPKVQKTNSANPHAVNNRTTFPHVPNSHSTSIGMFEGYYFHINGD
jgi:hypothetical protein